MYHVQSILLLQVQSLARLGWFLTAGTAAQECAILLVLVRRQQ